MVTFCFAVLDRKAGFFVSPFFFPSIGQAVRAFQDLVSDSSTSISRHPGDYALFQLSSWDDATGRFENAELPLHLCDASALVPRAPVQAALFEGEP